MKHHILLALTLLLAILCMAPAKTIVCSSESEALLACLQEKEPSIEPDSCSACLDSADERAGLREKISVCEAWNTNYCTAVAVCRVGCVGIQEECQKQFDAFQNCAPSEISEATSSPCPFSKCESKSRPRQKMWGLQLMLFAGAALLIRLYYKQHPKREWEPIHTTP